MSLCYVPGLTGAFIATQWPVLSILLPMLLLCGNPMTVFHWTGLFFIVYATARLWSTPIFDDGVYGLWLIYIMGASFWFGSKLESLRGLYAGLAIGASVSSVVAVFQWYGVSVIPYISGYPAGLYVNSVMQGIVLSLIAVALVSERMWLWVPMLAPGILLSGSRGAWIGLLAGLISAYVRSKWVLLAIGAVGFFFLTQPLSSSDAMRVSIWSAALQNLGWVGWGPGSFFSWVVPYGNSTVFPEYAHNDALQLVFEYGVVAALPIGIFAFVLTRTSEREWPLLVAFVVMGCYSMPLWVPVASFLACAAAGRVVRGWALVRIDSGRRRQHVVSSARRFAIERGSRAVSVVADS